LEKTPKVETKEKISELSSEDKIKLIETYKKELSPEEVERVFTIKTEVKKIEPVIEAKTEAPIVDPKVVLEPQIEMVAQTLMATAKEKVNTIYKDFDISGILNDPSLNTLQKVTLMSSLVEPNAKRMATIEKNLKTGTTEGTEGSGTKKTEFTAPEKEGKVDPDAGKKLLTLMSEELGIETETTEKTE